MRDDCRSSPIHQGPVTKIQFTCKIYKLIMEFTAQCHALYSHASVLSPRLSATHCAASSPFCRHGSVPRTVQPRLRVIATAQCHALYSLVSILSAPFLHFFRFLHLVALLALRYARDWPCTTLGTAFFARFIKFLTQAPHDQVIYSQARGLSAHTSPCGEYAIFCSWPRSGTGCLLGPSFRLSIS
jgi:hypothetical protein